MVGEELVLAGFRAIYSNSEKAVALHGERASIAEEITDFVYSCILSSISGSNSLLFRSWAMSAQTIA